MRTYFTVPIQFILLLSLATAVVSSTSRGQSSPELRYSVAGRFESGDAPSSVRFVFSVQPAPRTAPLVRLLGETPHEDRISLAPQYDPEAQLYSVTFDISLASSERRLQIELTDMHFVSLAMREHATSGPMSRSSVDGNFSVYTTPEGLPAQAQLLIGALELPLDQLPSEVLPTDVLSVHSVAFRDGSEGVPDDWKITVGSSGAATPALLFLPSGGRDWMKLDTAVLADHFSVMARFNGPGTYLLLGKVPR